MSDEGVFTIRHFSEITPAEASKDEGNITLPRADVIGPMIDPVIEDPNIICPWPWDPIQLVGAPLGQYHCPYCGTMVIAGMHHLDYRPETLTLDGRVLKR